MLVLPWFHGEFLATTVAFFTTSLTGYFSSELSEGVNEWFSEDLSDEVKIGESKQENIFH